MRFLIIVPGIFFAHLALSAVCASYCPDYVFPSQGRADAGSGMLNPDRQRAFATILMFLWLPLGPLNGFLWGLAVYWLTGEKPRPSASTTSDI